MFFLYHASFPLLLLGARDTIFYPDFFSTLMRNFIQLRVFGLTGRPIGLTCFSAPRILKQLNR